jgi:hypothetical protein
MMMFCLNCLVLFFYPISLINNNMMTILFKTFILIVNRFSGGW